MEQTHLASPSAPLHDASIDRDACGRHVTSGPCRAQRVPALRLPYPKHRLDADLDGTSASMARFRLIRRSDSAKPEPGTDRRSRHECCCENKDCGKSQPERARCDCRTCRKRAHDGRRSGRNRPPTGFGPASVPIPPAAPAGIGGPRAAGGGLCEKGLPRGAPNSRPRP